MARSGQRSEAGQAIVLVIGAVAFLAVVVIGIAWFGQSLVDAAQARTAADAAALAGVVDGRDAADRVARENGARLVSFRAVGSDVIVVVRVGRAIGTARAALESAGAYTRTYGRARSPDPRVRRNARGGDEACCQWRERGRGPA